MTNDYFILLNIYIKHKLIKIKVMGCGCKNKNNGGQQPQTQPTNTTVINTQQQQNSETVKSTVTKIVEKYYNKK